MKDWERIASFLGLNISYDLTSGILAMNIKSKIEKLFEDHSILNISKNVKAPTPITEDNLNVAGCFKEKWHPVDHTSAISMRLLMMLAFKWQSLADLALLSPLEKLAEGCINLQGGFEISGGLVILATGWQ